MPQVGSNNCSLFFLAILYQTLEQYHKYVVLCRFTHNANIKLSEARKCKGINSEPLIQVANLEDIFGKYNKKLYDNNNHTFIPREDNLYSLW